MATAKRRAGQKAGSKKRRGLRKRPPRSKLKVAGKTSAGRKKSSAKKPADEEVRREEGQAAPAQKSGQESRASQSRKKPRRKSQRPRKPGAQAGRKKSAQAGDRQVAQESAGEKSAAKTTQIGAAKAPRRRPRSAPNAKSSRATSRARVRHAPLRPQRGRRRRASAARPAERPHRNVGAPPERHRDAQAAAHSRPGSSSSRARWASATTKSSPPTRSPSSPICIAVRRRAARRCLKARVEQQARYDAGELPDFLPRRPATIRDGDWKVAPIPADLLDRRVEITGPVDRKMIINALNSGANVFMADFEDANSPTWANKIEGQINLKDRWAGKIDFTDPETRQGLQARRQARGADRPPARLASGRGASDRSTASRSPARCSISASTSSTTRKALIAPGTRPYFYLPEAREPSRSAAVERRVRVTRRSALGLPPGTIKATVLIETLPAAFEMDEILYELRDHIAGLNCGRWDYIFSFIKKLAKQPELHPARPRPGRDGQGVPRRLFGAADQDLPSPRRLRDGRHGGADPGQERPAGQRRGLRQGRAPTRSARRATATTAPGSRIPISCRSRWRCSTA